MRFFTFSLICLSLILLSCAKKEQTPATIVFRDLAYDADSLQRLDIFIPSGKTKQNKCVILIHGGGWGWGDKSSCNYFSSLFVERGYVAVQINYRLAGQTVHLDEILNDIGKAINFITSNASGWKIDTTSMTIFGHSAGAQLALVYAYRFPSAHSIGNVVSLSAATDFTDTTLLNISGNRDLINLLLGDTSTTQRRNASPLYLVHPNVASTLLIHGKLDPYFPYHQSEILQNKLDLEGVTNKLLLFNYEGHELYPPYISNEDNAVLWEEVFRFIRE
ncbi:MAG: alpha/beta hydrolase [Bacteroidota bacterium]